MSAPPAAPPARCPVCGEGFEAAPPEVCGRCDTPHHRECWEYVPGCAVFGCADAAGVALPTENWPEAHGLVVEGMRWVGFTAVALQAVPVVFTLGLVLTLALDARPPLVWLLYLPFLLASVATVYGMRRAFRVKHEVQRRGLGGVLQAAGTEEEGDRRLARAVAERTGRTLPVAPSLAGLGLAVATVAPLALTGRAELDLYLVVAFLALVFYVALKLPARWVGWQRILANRLGAAIEASQPRKPLPPG